MSLEKIPQSVQFGILYVLILVFLVLIGSGGDTLEQDHIWIGNASDSPVQRDEDIITVTLIDDVDTPSDEECATYEADSTDIEWQACGAGGGTSVALDLTDDDVDESSGLTEIATTGDTNSIFTEPTADKVLIDAGQDWPNSDTTDSVNVGGFGNANDLTVNGDVANDAIGTAEFNDGSDTPSTGECVKVATDTAAIEYASCVAGSGDIDDVFSCITGSCQSVTVQSGDTLLIDDDVNLNFGAGSDWMASYEEADEDTLSIHTAKTATSGIDNGMVTIAVDTGNLGATANQEVFEIGKGALDDGDVNFTELFAVDEDGDVTYAGTLNATTATALAANPSDCSANEFADAIAANGDLTCNAIVDADVPDTITIDLAATATALAADPADCAADTKADSIAASGALTCSAVDTGDITDNTILEADLKAVDAASDEECLTFESTGGDFEWQSCSAGGGTMNAVQANDVGVGDADIVTLDFSTDFAVTETPDTEINIDLSDTLDLGAHTSFEIPNGAGNTVNADGEIAHDTTADQLILGADADVISTIYTKSITMESPADADLILLGKWSAYGITITDIHCIVDPADSTESVVIDIQEANSTADTPVTVDATITCDNDGAEDDGALSNGAIDKNDWWYLDIGTVIGTVSQLSVTIDYTITRE